MRRRTLVYFVCSPHSRTGVTTAARLLTDFYLARGDAVEGFDMDSREPTYARLFPQISRVVDIREVKGQISLFDRLLVADETPKIVDVWSHHYDEFFATIAEIGFLEEAKRAGVEPLIFFQTDSSQVAASNARLLNTTWPDLWMTVIHNEGAAPLGPEAHQLLAAYPAKGKLVIPRLEIPVAKALENEELSLSAFLKEPNGPTSISPMSIVVRAALKNWLLSIFTQLQSFELRIDLQSSEFLR
jgi:hypothetical protein